MAQKTEKIKKAQLAVQTLKQLYPNAKCSLNAETPFQLLVATRLSAQCTDARVNLVTPALFEKFPNAESFKNAEIEEIETLIKSCGLYKTKARDLKKLSKMLVEKYSGELPKTLEELVKLPGVGRKTANLICGDVYGLPAVVADTHCIRISNRLGLTDSKNPKTVELQLKELLKKDESNAFCHRLVLFGREICTARSPKCTACPMSGFCKEYKSL